MGCRQGPLAQVPPRHGFVLVAPLFLASFPLGLLLAPPLSLVASPGESSASGTVRPNKARCCLILRVGNYCAMHLST